MTITEPTTDLGEFEGDDVVETAIEIPNAGGGLNEAMKTAPVILHKGGRIKVLLECELRHVSFPPVKKGEGVIRRHTLSAVNATIVDGKVFDEALAAQAAANQARIDAEKGQSTVESQLADEHAAGDHATGLVDGCPDCAAEQAAVDAEAGEE